MTVTVNESYAGLLVELTDANSDESRMLYRAAGEALKELIAERFENSGNEGQPWLEQYPTAKEPWINLAGAVSDWAKGKAEPDAKRFSKQPPLVDSGALKDSMSYRVVDEGVEVTSNSEYADLHNTGGTSVQQITRAMRTKISKFIKSKETPWQRLTSGVLGPMLPGSLKPSENPWREKLGFLLSTDQLATDLVKRPFMESNERLEEALAERIEQIVKKGPS